MSEPTSSEDQKAALGKVKKRPMQRDLFTGELVTKPIKRGNGRHIKLKSVPGEKPHVAGMASWAGTGPEGKYCRDCDFFGTIKVRNQRDEATAEMIDGCALYAKRMGHLPMVKKNISACNSCDQFKPAVELVRIWLIDHTGMMINGKLLDARVLK